MKIHDHGDRAALVRELADALAGDLRAALARQDRASLALPGGTTPAPVFEALAAAQLDWARMDVLPGDERFLEATSARSNARLIREHLLRGAAAAARLLPCPGPETAPSPQAAAATWSAALAPVLPLSVLLLGMGADRHTASLFPGADGLGAALAPDAPPALALAAPGAPEPRISLTAPVLRGAGTVRLLITGPEKRAALEAARDAAPEAAPVSIVLDRAEVHWAP